MKILIVSSEAMPYFKTGGLGDVCGSLAKALAERGHDARLAMPRYRSIETQNLDIAPLMPEILVDVEGQSVNGAIDVIRGENPAYLVRCDRYFDRDNAYCEVVAGKMRDYTDNLERFGFFCMAVLWMLKGLNWRPDIIHCNDWQTALIPVYLKTNPIVRADPFYADIRTVFSIHNLAFQGIATHTMLPRIGQGLDACNIEPIAIGGGINLMRGAILASDRISTVSRRYAEEIQTPELGCGLDGLLRSQSDRLKGIVNGIDDEVWNPARDPHIPATFTPESLQGKTTCKRRLQREFGLPERADVPLIGIVSRLSRQKGFELLDACLARIMDKGAQLAVLGSGEPRYHRMLDRMRRRHRDQIGVKLEFDDACGHRVVAGADMYMMPSYYEPCGLNQMFAMRYGAPPVVRMTGGLADTVVNVTSQTLRKANATGFVFKEFTPRAMLGAVSRALDLYADSPRQWQTLMRTGMRKDFSWANAAGQYEDLYREIVDERNRPID